MSVEIEHLEDIPAIIAHFREPFTPNEDIITSIKQTAQILDTTEHKIFYRIDDLSNLNISFSDMVQGMAQSTQKNTPGSSLDPRLRVILVGSDDFILQIQNFAKQEQYGGMNLSVFATIAEAKKYIRTQLSLE